MMPERLLFASGSLVRVRARHYRRQMPAPRLVSCISAAALMADKMGYGFIRAHYYGQSADIEPRRHGTFPRRSI